MDLSAPTAKLENVRVSRGETETMDAESWSQYIKAYGRVRHHTPKIDAEEETVALMDSLPLCRVCKNLSHAHWQTTDNLDDNPRGTRFMQPVVWKCELDDTYASVTQIQASARNGCRLCSVILTSLFVERILELEGPQYSLLPVRIDYEIVETNTTTTLRVLPLLRSAASVGREFHDWAQLVRPEELQILHSDRVWRFPSSDSTLSTESLLQITDWIRHCKEEHEPCNQNIFEDSNVKALPTRLLRLGTLDQPLLRLIDGKDLPVDAVYFTLSHCWGSAVLTKLTEAVLDGYRVSIDITQLSKTFQDAIHVARSLGAYAIWIDALCIIQDSAEDWSREAPLMYGVYHGAELNIAATASVDGSGGLGRQRDPSHLGGCLVRTTWANIPSLQNKGRQCVLLIRPKGHTWYECVSQARLMDRGWVYQELSLAKRVVHFADQQLFWECNLFRASESQPRGRCPHGHDYDGGGDHNRRKESLWGRYSTALSTRSDRQSHWRGIVGHYNQCRLTYATDKLPALSGLAECMAKLCGWEMTDYLAGIWREGLPEALLWRAVRRSNLTHSSTYCAPSWSWASTDTVFTYRSDFPKQKVLMSIVETCTEPKDHPLGSITNAWVKLEAPCCVIDLFVESDSSYPLNGVTKLDVALSLDCFGIGHLKCVFAAVRYYTDNPSPSWFNPPNTDPKYPGYTYASGNIISLVLQPTSRTRGEYRRVGVLEVDESKHASAVAYFEDAFMNSKLESDEYEQECRWRKYLITIV